MYSKSILLTVLIAFLLVFSTGCTSKVDEVCDEIPDLYGLISDGTQVELVRFGYTWRKGDLSSSEGLTEIADTMAPYQYEHYKTENTITVTDQTPITLSTSGETVEGGYIKALRYTIWKPDGNVYDDGHREVYSSLSLRMSTDGDGNVVLIAPFERGEYFFNVQLEFERGTVEYAFKVIVSFVTVPEAQEIVHEYYREATDIRYTGQKDINYVSLLLPVDAYTFEVDVNGETLICAVSYEDGIFFIHSDDMWQKPIDAKLRRNVSISSMPS